jgi:hypothetical protein
MNGFKWTDSITPLASTRLAMCFSSASPTVSRITYARPVRTSLMPIPMSRTAISVDAATGSITPV